MKQIKSRLGAVEALETRCVLAALFPAYVDGQFTLGDPYAEFPYGEENTFKLESLPESDKTIFIDFDGHLSTNNEWDHTINFPPFTLDGSFDFSREELLEIQLTFQNVAEDFLPFDINVTTVDPGVAALTKVGALDEEYGLRVVASQPTNGFGGGTGGLALLDIFADSRDTPVFAFNKGANVGAMTISHEAGHGLGLFHDGLNGAQYHPGVGGSGPTSWGPIMGAPFSANITQWSPGDYDGSTNTEDDFAVFTNNRNDVQFRTDDFGSTIVDAEPLALGGGLHGWGIIEESTDQDAFTFDWEGGDLELFVRGFGGRPNLDIQADLFDSQGNLVSSSNPVDSPDAELAVSGLEAGEYVVLVDGVGLDGRYSEYGSLGLYTLEGPTPVGDLVADGQWNCADVDLLVERIAFQDSPRTILDDFESYSTGGLDVDRTGGVWRFGMDGANPPATLADDGSTVVPLIDIGTDGGDQYLSGTSSHGRPDADPKPNARDSYTSRPLGPATVLEGTSRRIAFDVFVTADDRSPANIGFSTQAEITLPTRWAGFIQIVPNQFDSNGTGPVGDGVADTFSVSGRNGGTLVPQLVTGLATNEWYTLEFDIDAAANTYDVYFEEQLIAEDFRFRNNANNGNIQTIGFSGLEHVNSTSPVYNDNDGVRIDNLRYGPNDLPRFDLNEDGVVDLADLDSWLEAAGSVNLLSGNSFLYGDANLDGNVDVADFAIWNSNKFTATTGWCNGDFNADGVLDVSDFSSWNANKFTSSGEAQSGRGLHQRTPVGAGELERALPFGHSDVHGQDVHSHAYEHAGHAHDDDHDHADFAFTMNQATDDEPIADSGYAGLIDLIFAT